MAGTADSSVSSDQITAPAAARVAGAADPGETRGAARG
jgi:hypothetical protein